MRPVGTIKSFKNNTIQERMDICKYIIDNDISVEEMYNVKFDDKDRDDAYIINKITQEEFDEYKEYALGKEYQYTKLDRALDFIRKGSGKSTLYEKWFLKTYNGTNLFLYSEMTKNEKTAYLSLRSYEEENIDNYRGCCMGKGIIVDRDSDDPRNDNVDVVLHDQNETEESLAWTLLHEMGHVHVRNHVFDDAMSIMMHLRNNYEKANAPDYYKKYTSNDKVHEEAPEEVYCNMIANNWLGKKLDRYWWRENMAPKKENK